MATLKYKGSANFRMRIVTSILSSRPLRIEKIREDHEQPGLHDCEASFLRLIDKLSDGCQIEINETGTLLKFKPGILLGGQKAIIVLLLFAKSSSKLTLNGITNDAVDLSVDTINSVTIPLLGRLLGITGLELKIRKRGFAPKGGGVVEFTCPIVRDLPPIEALEEGYVKRIRGISVCCKVSPTLLTRVIESSRFILNQCIPDVYITADHYSGATSGHSAGYSILLTSESNTGAVISVERTAEQGELPENVGREAALLLLQEIKNGGVIDSSHQVLVLQLMILGPEDVSKVRFGGKLSPSAIAMLRLLRDAFGVVFKVKEEKVDNPSRTTLVLSCLGVGYKNMARRVAS